jgi:hypothetical protein
MRFEGASSAIQCKPMKIQTTPWRGLWVQTPTVECAIVKSFCGFRPQKTESGAFISSENP